MSHPLQHLISLTGNICKTCASYRDCPISASKNSILIAACKNYKKARKSSTKAGEANQMDVPFKPKGYGIAKNIDELFTIPLN